MVNLSERFAEDGGNFEEEFDLDASARVAEPASRDLEARAEEMASALSRLSGVVTSYITLRMLAADALKSAKAQGKQAALFSAGFVIAGVATIFALMKGVSAPVTVGAFGLYLLFCIYTVFSMTGRICRADAAAQKTGIKAKNFFRAAGLFAGFAFLLTAASAATAFIVTALCDIVSGYDLPLYAAILSGLAIAGGPLLYLAAQGGLTLPAYASDRVTSLRIAIIQTGDRADTVFKALAAAGGVCVALPYGAYILGGATAATGAAVTAFGLWSLFAGLVFTSLYKLSGRMRDPNYAKRAKGIMPGA